MKRFLSFIGITNLRELLTVISCIVAIFAAFKINQYINPGLNIYIFYQEEKYSGRVNDMAMILEKNGISVETELAAYEYPKEWLNTIRYFNDSDRKNAEKIHSIIQGSSANVIKNLTVQNLTYVYSGRKLIRKGNIEIWIGNNSKFSNTIKAKN